MCKTLNSCLDMTLKALIFSDIYTYLEHNIPKKRQSYAYYKVFMYVRLYV